MASTSKVQPPRGSRSPSRRILETAKTLVVAYGQSEAARQLGIPLGTVCAWASRYQWRRVSASASANDNKPTVLPEHETPPALIPSQAHEERNSPSNALAASLRSHRNASQLHLAQWTADAAKEAVEASDKLANAKRVRDVAAVHSILWPNESVTEILSLSLLTGASHPRPAETVNMPPTEQALRLDGTVDQESTAQGD